MEKGRRRINTLDSLKRNSPFQKEGGAVSGDTRRSQAVRMYPW